MATKKTQSGPTTRVGAVSTHSGTTKPESSTPDTSAEATRSTDNPKDSQSGSGRAATERNAKTPSDKPVSSLETASASERTDAEQPKASVLLGTQPEVDYEAREKQLRADLKAAKADKQARMDAAIAEIEAADESLTEAAAPFSDDVRPDFTTMDEEGIKRFMRVFTQWLRDRDAVVRGPEVTAHEVASTSGTEVTREANVTPDMNKVKDTVTVYEGFYEWEYEGSAMPVTIRRVHVTAIEALRDCALEAFTRRYEV